jgi:hypothetical protein
MVHGITSILTDVYIFILPQPMLWNLQIPITQKVGIFILFGIGLLKVFSLTRRETPD